MVWQRLRGAVTRATQQLANRINKRQCVGQDLAGNSYYQYQQQKSQVVLRSIEYSKHRDSGLPSPQTVPMSAHQWLREARNDFPSLEEMRREVIEAEQLASRVAKINAQDEKLRRQEIADKALGDQESFEVDLSSAGIIRQLEQAQMQQAEKAQEQQQQQRAASSAAASQRAKQQQHASQQEATQQSDARTAPHTSWRPNPRPKD